MTTTEDLMSSLQRPRQQPAPAWHIRITFHDGTSADRTIQSAQSWPAPLAAHPPLGFVARQTLGWVRRLRQELGMDAELVRIEPPPGTIDSHGREVRRDIVLALAR